MSTRAVRSWRHRSWAIGALRTTALWDDGVLRPKSSTSLLTQRVVQHFSTSREPHM